MNRFNEYPLNRKLLSLNLFNKEVFYSHSESCEVSVEFANIKAIPK
jgi:hypothetical protein